MTQYPHTITITKQPELLQDEYGNPYSQTDGTQYVYSCRLEPANQNAIVTGTNGDHIVCTWTVYMESIEIEFTPGDRATVTLSNGSQYNGSVKRQSNGQLNTRIWL